MKKIRGFKIALLIVLMAMLLAVLSSCYIPPDDVNTEGGNTNVNNLPFQTMEPVATATATQEVVVIQTQNIFGNNTSTPEPQGPTGTPPMNSWGIIATTNSVAAQATPTPALGQTVVLITAEPGGNTGYNDPNNVPIVTATPTAYKEPTQPPVTNTPAPAVMQLGFNGDEVRKLQRKLKELGYYTGSVDGDFGAATDKAVKAFQKANGLTADGKVGSKTESVLYSGKAVKAGATATPKKTATPTPKKTATPTPKKTATPTPKKTPTPTPRATATPNLSKDYYLTSGSSGSKVKTLQTRLIALGWLQGKPTGNYDAATEAAVKAFQKKVGVWSDGIAGPDTLKALYASNAPKTSSPASSTGETLEEGSTGSAVRTLQSRLKKLGYYNGSIDGSYGAGTKAAVIAFQSKNGLTADGKAGTATLNKIYSDDAKSASSGSDNGSSSGNNSNSSSSDNSDIGSTGYVTLENGSKGTAVTNLQKRLKELNYYSGPVDGVFGEATETAVRAFQKKNDLRVDGKAGPATQRVLYGTSANIAYNTLELGTTGTTVKNLQYTLYELGYYDGPRDGIYGDTTADAVRAFQIQNKLTPVDGKAGSKTLAKLYSSTAVPAAATNVNPDTIYPGDRGNRVYEVQDCLVAMGYLDHVTNIYDDDTVAAVKAFQKDNGLTADGICGGRTLQILFGY